MALTVAPDQDGIQTALRSFLLTFLPSDVEVVAGQDNRVPEPVSGDYVVMQAMRRIRLATNLHTYDDVWFIASISATTMTVSQVVYGSIVLGRTLYGPGVTSGTTIIEQLTGFPGGIGTYRVSATQNLTSRKMASGIQRIVQPTQVAVQLSVHGPRSSDLTQIITTMLRDERGTSFFEQSGVDVQPLYPTDPLQLPFINGEQQYETRYAFEAVLQANQKIEPGQQFADWLEAEVINVEAAYPATLN